MATFPKIRRTQFPDRAGQCQQAGDLAALIEELGSNYEHYHEFLAKSLVSHGGRPTKARFRDRESYVDAWAVAQDLARAEIVLRACFDYVTAGRPLDQNPDPRHGAVVTPDNQLHRSDFAP